MDIGTDSLLGHYEIHHQLGAGGMGKVFFARDTLLGRPVALKILSPALTTNTEHLRRFKQEARLTSGLNHPNILTIYEIGKVDSILYIAAEFVDGYTLRRRLSEGSIEYAEVLDISIQIASALTAAHEAGIIHRDIKPENIMLRPDGYVKVLDFGLAKLAETKIIQAITPEASTITNLDTSPGAILGTTLYMSPEQLRGQKVDARTDVWSLGVLMYEMLTGHFAFDGSTKSDAIASILNKEPPPLVEYSPNLPVEFQRIITKALQKDREQRYESAKDLLLNLKELRRDIELATAREDARGRDSSGDAHRISDRNQQLGTSLNKGRPQTDELGLIRPTRKIGLLADRIKSRKEWILILAVLVLAGVSVYFYLFSARSNSGKNQGGLVFTRLLLTGNVKEAVISPDGKYVVSIIDEAGAQSLWVRQINTASDLQIVASASGRFKGLSFSPDGDYIYYLKEEGDSGELYRVPALGGTARKLASNVDTRVTFSPDGSRLAFVRLNVEDQYSTSLIIAGSDGAGEQKLVTIARPQALSLGFYGGGPAWSPDGKVIACAASNITAGSSVDVISVQVADGTIRPINAGKWFMIEKLVWLPDGSGLLMNATDRRGSPFQIWSLSYPDGTVRRVTNDPNAYIGLSLTRDSKTLLTIKSTKLSNIWVLPLGYTHQAVQIRSSRDDGSTGISWASDGKIVYASNETGSQNIWIMNSDGTDRKQLTFDDHVNIEPAISPDGRYIVFASFGNGQPHIWRTETDGANPRQLTKGGYEDLPRFSPDGRWVIYHSFDPIESLWKIPIEGGEPSRLTQDPSTQPDVSPDGRLIACFSHGKSPNAPWMIAIIEADSGTPLKTFPLPPTVSPTWPGLRWFPDGLSVTYSATSGGISNIWSQPLSGDPAKQLTDFQENQIYAFDWSFSNKRLACARGMVSNDTLLIQGFR